MPVGNQSILTQDNSPSRIHTEFEIRPQNYFCNRKTEGLKSLESLRTRLDSSNSDNEKHLSTSPRIERPIPIKTSPVYPWSLKSLFSQINFISQTQMHKEMN